MKSTIQKKKRKIVVLIVFDVVVVVVTSNKKLHLVVSEFFIREQELYIALVFITQSYFPVPKDVKQTPHTSHHKD